ncbi:MAG: hypothetical protein NTX50_28850, partial [Candidatus Sumerlaeota bacterium]|nr:hypothetical protein [Candidatus Sumerlaeota bacterium]
QVYDYETSKVDNGRFSLRGRFRGEYQIHALINEPAMRIPGILALDNLAGDQDLGEIILPVTGWLRVELSYASVPASTERPKWATLFLVPQIDAQTDAEKASTACPCINFQLDLSKPEHVLEFVPERRYDAYLTAQGWKPAPYKKQVAVQSGTTATVSFELQPQCCLTGFYHLPNGFPKGAMARSISLTEAATSETRKASLQQWSKSIHEENGKGVDSMTDRSFYFQSLKEGIWRLMIEADECETFTQDCEVKPGKWDMIQAHLKKRGSLSDAAATSDSKRADGAASPAVAPPVAASPASNPFAVPTTPPNLPASAYSADQVSHTNSGTAPDTTCVVKGVVTFTGAPVAGARVSLISSGASAGRYYSIEHDTKTDSNGAYQTMGYAESSCFLSVSFERGTSSYLNRDRFQTSAGRERIRDIAIIGGAGALHGRVFNEGEPFSGAAVTIAILTDWNRERKIYTKTSQEGEFRFDELEECSYSCTINEESQPGIRVDGDTRHDIVLRKNHTLKMEIVFDDAPDGKEPLVITSAHFWPNINSVVVKGNQLEFRGLFKRLYSLELTCETTGGIPVSVKYAGLLDVDSMDKDQDLGKIHISLKGASLKGVICMPDGKPAQGASISLYRYLYGNIGVVGNFSANKRGEYEFLGLRDDRYRSYVLWSDYSDWTTTLTSFRMAEYVEVKGATQRDFKFPPRLPVHDVTGRMTLGRNETRLNLTDIRRLQIKLLGTEESFFPNGPLQISAEESASYDGNEPFLIRGRFRGEYILFAEIGTQSIRIPGAIRLDNLERNQDLGAIRMPPLGAVRVQLASAAVPDDSSIDTLLSLEFKEIGRDNSSTMSSSLRFSINRRKSEHEIFPVPAGRYNASFDWGAWRTEPYQAAVTVESGKPATVKFAIQPQGLLQGFAIMLGSPTMEAKPRLITLTGFGETRTIKPRNMNDDIEEEYAAGRDVGQWRLFWFQNLKEGTWRLKIETDGWETYTKDFDIKPGKGGQNRFYLKQNH